MKRSTWVGGAPVADMNRRSNASRKSVASRGVQAAASRRRTSIDRPEGCCSLAGNAISPPENRCSTRRYSTGAAVVKAWG